MFELKIICEPVKNKMDPKRKFKVLLEFDTKDPSLLSNLHVLVHVGLGPHYPSQ